MGEINSGRFFLGRVIVQRDEAKAELRVLEEALKRIRDHGETHDEPCWALHKGDCADKMQEIARAALAASPAPLREEPIGKPGRQPEEDV
jgi:hypothetical protein